jgi:hypothetical protein
MLGGFQAYKGVVWAVLLLIMIVAFPGGLASLAATVAARLRPSPGASR